MTKLALSNQLFFMLCRCRTPSTLPTIYRFQSRPQFAAASFYPFFVSSQGLFFMDSLSVLSLQQKLWSSDISIAVRRLLSKFHFPSVGALVSVVDASLSFYFRYCGLSPCTLHIDDHTYVHFWVVNTPNPDRPNLVIIHGFGADSKSQFINQIGALSKCFNLYAPDLIFFGKSYSKHPDRSDTFQASCVAAGLKKLGVLRYSAYGISYGGYVVYRMALLHPEALEKIVIASSGIACGKQVLIKQLSMLDKDFKEVLLPQKPEDFRLLVNFSFGKGDPFNWLPDSIIRLLIDAFGKDNLKEKKELAEYLITVSENEIPNITQETLLVWGDNDKIFPVSVGIDLQRKLGSKATLEIIKNTGHALNMESSNELNSHIKAFVASRQEV